MRVTHGDAPPSPPSPPRRRANFGRRTGVRRLISSGDSRARRSRRARRARAGASVAAGSRTRDVVVDPRRGRADGATHRLDAFGIGIVALFCLGVRRRGEIRVRAAVHHARTRRTRTAEEGRKARVGVESRRVRQRTRNTTRQTVAGVKRAGDRRAVPGGRRTIRRSSRASRSLRRARRTGKPEPDARRTRARRKNRRDRSRADRRRRPRRGFRRRPGRRIPWRSNARGRVRGWARTIGSPRGQPRSGRGIVEDEDERRARASDVDEGGAPHAPSPLVTETCAVDGRRGAGSRTRWWSWR